MQVPKPTETDRQRFRDLVPDDPQVHIKPMFGNLAAFVNGNMFSGLFGSDVGVKLDPVDQERLRAAGGAPYGPSERPMSGYLTIPVELPPGQQRDWVLRALAYVSDLPPKTPRSRARARPPV